MKIVCLAGAAVLAAPASPSADAPPPSPAADAGTPQRGHEEPRDIVVTATQQRTVIGDIPPENVLSGMDLRATGATDMNELLEALAPQVGSSRGRAGDRAILLLNGQRISSFRELRDIPPDAISRLEILPEEVSLRYGYRADQRVVNIVLQAYFRSVAPLAGITAATEGGFAGGTADLTRVGISGDRRTTINLHVERSAMLREDERDILPMPPPGNGGTGRAARSLIPSRREARGTLTHSRRIGNIAATSNLELGLEQRQSLIGTDDASETSLARRASSTSAHAGLVLSGEAGPWRWSVTGNADYGRSITRTGRAAPGAPERARTTTRSGALDLLANGTLLDLPAGALGATFRIAVSKQRLDGARRPARRGDSIAVERAGSNASINIDLPVSRRGRRSAPLGNLTINGNAEVERLSDFGTLATIGAGMSWSPARRLDLIASWTREESAPTLQQLGDPVLETRGLPQFDFTTGRTILVTVVTGGNDRLRADRRHVVKLGASWKPFQDNDLRLHADYVRSRISGPIVSLPGATPALEVAFPDRFVRNAAGELVRIDLRPLNIESSRRHTFRIGFDVSMLIGASQASPHAPLPARVLPDDEVEGTGPADLGPSPGGVRTLFGPEFGTPGRLRFSLTDTITMVDEATIRDGLKLDYLHGDAVGQTGGRPRHEIEGRAGYFRDGHGAFLAASWRSGTRAADANGSDLRFAPRATFDLRLFATLNPRMKLVSRHPWLEGASIHFELTNLLNSRPKVRDARGNVPLGYQPALLDPVGRTIGITFRKGGGGAGG